MSDELKKFLESGGKITKLETVAANPDRYSRFKHQDHTKHDGHSYRIDNFKKKTGTVPKDHKMYMAFRKRMGVDL